tara:strand:- start:1877 stop:2140 length:264 start_codon:yes stop_codon:yes gene_type:complete
LRCFFADLAAVKTVEILELNRKTIDRYYNIFREKILHYSYKELEKVSGEIEVDESYFEARRVRGKHGRGAAGKTPVFGLFKKRWKST